MNVGTDPIEREGHKRWMASVERTGVRPNKDIVPVALLPAEWARHGG